MGADPSEAKDKSADAPEAKTDQDELENAAAHQPAKRDADGSPNHRQEGVEEMSNDSKEHTEDLDKKDHPEASHNPSHRDQDGVPNAYQDGTTPREKKHKNARKKRTKIKA